MQLPESVATSSFLVFDALKDTPDRVIERLTSALVLNGGDDVKEMGFQETKQPRLQYAWELCLLFRHNAELVESKARWVQRLITLAAFLTAFCAVLLNASNEARLDDALAQSAGSDGLVLDPSGHTSSEWRAASVRIRVAASVDALEPGVALCSCTDGVGSPDRYTK